MLLPVKALVPAAYNDIVVRDVPLPSTNDEDAVVRVKAYGICGSDVHGFNGSTGQRLPPIVVGHEAAGIIATVVARVRGWEVGERVTFDSTIFCGECWYCRRGFINLSDNRRVLGVSRAEYPQDGCGYPKGFFAQAAMVEVLSIDMRLVCSNLLEQRQRLRYLRTKEGPYDSRNGLEDRSPLWVS
jgi:threonine dehydrogenase-like Zn-dependent dehydrogenase